MFLVNCCLLSNLSYISIKLLVTFLYKYLCVPVLHLYTFLQCDGFSPLFVSFHISPHCVITTAIFGLLFGPVGTFSIFLKTKSPSITLPENKMEKQLEINLNFNKRCYYKITFSYQNNYNSYVYR